MLPIGILITLAALGSLLGRLLQVLFRVLRKRFPAFDRWTKKHIDPVFRLLQFAVRFVLDLVVTFVATTARLSALVLFSRSPSRKQLFNFS